MKYCLKIISPLGTFTGKEMQEWNEEQLAAAKATFSKLMENPAYMSMETENSGYIVLGPDTVKGSILCIELAE